MKGTLPWHNPEVRPHHKRGRHQYGVRDTPCVLCNKLFRKDDVAQGLCTWCAWDQLPWWKRRPICSTFVGMLDE